MYKISNFSKITGITVKALRYYDEEGILTPSIRGENNYRFYTEADFEKANIIVMLREFDFSIAEIKDVLEHYSSDEDIAMYLSEKKDMITTQISKQRKLIKKINEKIKIYAAEDITMDYKFEIKEVKEMQVISMRFKSSWEDTGAYIGKLYGAAKAKTNGSMTTIYHDGEYKDIADIEICVPVSSKVNASGIENKTLPAIKALSTTHIGRYEDLKKAYKSLIDYAEKNSIKLSTPHREICIKGPGMILKGNPDKYVTEIMFPIE